MKHYYRKSYLALLILLLLQILIYTITYFSPLGVNVMIIICMVAFCSMLFLIGRVQLWYTLFSVLIFFCRYCIIVSMRDNLLEYEPLWFFKVFVSSISFLVLAGALLLGFIFSKFQKNINVSLILSVGALIFSSIFMLIIGLRFLITEVALGGIVIIYGLFGVANGYFSKNKWGLSYLYFVLPFIVYTSIFLFNDDGFYRNFIVTSIGIFTISLIGTYIGYYMRKNKVSYL